MKAAVYARVSTDKQDELSQIPTLRAFAESRGFEIVAEYTDTASGRDGNRPGWKALMASARKHDFDVILAVKLDRVMRSVTNLLDILNQLQSYRVSLMTVDLGLLDTTTASGNLMVQVLGAVAEWERKVISERTKEGLNRRRRDGVTLGAPKKEPRIHEIALMRIEGRSWTEISKLQGVPRSTINGYRAEIDAEVDRIKTGL